MNYQTHIVREHQQNCNVFFALQRLGSNVGPLDTRPVFCLCAITPVLLGNIKNSCKADNMGQHKEWA